MKKYLQISFFIGIFGSLILIKNVYNHDDTQIAIVTINKLVPTPEPNKRIYKDGTFTGSVEDAYYGNIQAQAIIKDGQIVDVIFLQYPNDNRTSVRVNSQAMPYLKEETIRAQSAKIDIVTGASESSIAFRKSMATALSSAHK